MQSLYQWVNDDVVAVGVVTRRRVENIEDCHCKHRIWRVSVLLLLEVPVGGVRVGDTDGVGTRLSVMVMVITTHITHALTLGFPIVMRMLDCWLLLLIMLMLTEEWWLSKTPYSENPVFIAQHVERLAPLLCQWQHLWVYPDYYLIYANV